MNTDIYLKLQKKYGGKWIASDKSGKQIFSQAKNVNQLFDLLNKKGISPNKTTIGFIEKYGQISAYFSISVQKN